MLNMYFCVHFYLNRKIDKKMKSRNSNLLNVIKFCLFYVSIVFVYLNNRNNDARFSKINVYIYIQLKL